MDIAVGVPAWSITADDWSKSKFNNLIIKKTIKGRINNFNKIENLISSLRSKILPFWFVIIPSLVPTIIIVGTRLGIITNQKGRTLELNEGIKFSILLKLFILPFIVFLICKILNFDFYQSSAVILQAGTPTAISTILMAEAYDVKQKIASKILFTTTLISIFTIPLLKILLNGIK